MSAKLTLKIYLFQNEITKTLYSITLAIINLRYFKLDIRIYALHT